jgi:hypothetical protein
VDRSESLQSPDPPLPARRIGTSTVTLGQDLRRGCAFVCFRCGILHGPSIAPRTLNVATKYSALDTEKSIYGSRSWLYPCVRSPHGDRVISSEPAPAKLRAKRSLESVKSSKNLRPGTSRKGSRATCPATDQGPYSNERTSPAEVSRMLAFAPSLLKWRNIIASSSPLKSAIASLPSGKDTVKGSVQVRPSSTTQKA